MRLRAAHLAFVMLLLSSLGAAEARALRGVGGGASRHALGSMLQQDAPALHAETPLAQRLQATVVAEPIASPAPLSAVWTMRPPAAHSALINAVTAARA